MDKHTDLRYGIYDEEDCITITLTLEDDTELECSVVAFFSVKDKDYIALVPLNEPDPEELFYRAKRTNNDLVFEDIEDDMEFITVSETFDELIEEESEGKDFIISRNRLIRCEGSDKDIVIPDRVTRIDKYAFHGCYGLRSVVIPKTVTNINPTAFLECDSLMNITVDENNADYKDIDGNLYSKDGKVLLQYALGKEDKSFTIPDGVISIVPYAFHWANNLTSVIIPEGVTSIGDNAFFSCSSLTDIKIPDSVTNIGIGAFSYCDNLKRVVLPNGLEDIGDKIFYRSKKLSNVVIPPSVKRIGKESFWGCGLKSVSLGKNVTNIGFRAFYACYKLKSITVDKENDNYKDIDGDLYTKDGKVLIQYAIGKKETSFTIPNGVVSISDWALWGCDRLANVVIPDTVTSIGEHAFSAWNSSLTSIIIPDGVTTIGEYAFSDCKKLTNVVIGKGVTNIGKWSFSRCENIIIKGYAGSYAETYAKENGIPFEEI